MNRARSALGAVSLAWACAACSGPVTTSSVSPDGAWRVSLVERRSFVDRNFEVTLQDVASRKTRTVFRSPDEGRPPGSERFVWSADGGRFLLLGRKFFAEDRALLASGELAYLMMDLKSGMLWCNAKQQTRYPGFGVEELRGQSWTGWEP